MLLHRTLIANNDSVEFVVSINSINMYLETYWLHDFIAASHELDDRFRRCFCYMEDTPLLFLGTMVLCSSLLQIAKHNDVARRIET